MTDEDGMASWLSNLDKATPPVPHEMDSWVADLKAATETNERYSLSPEAIGGEVVSQLRTMRAKTMAKERYRQEQRASLESGVLDELATKLREQYMTDMKQGAELDDIPDPEPLIDGLLYRGTVNYLVGASGAFKSIAALDIAGRVGDGKEFCGMTVEQGRTLYVVAEGLSGMKFRRQAWEAFHNLHEEMRNVTFLPYAVQIGNPSEMAACIDVVRAGDYDLVIFDTQAMCTLGFDENNNTEMSIITDALGVMARVTNSCVLTVHHTGKNAENGMRGASSQYANVNTVIAADRQGSSMQITLSTARAKGGKQKDAREIECIRFNIVEVGASIVLAQGLVEDEHTRTAGLPNLNGRYDITILNLLVGHENLGATKAEVTRWVIDSGVKNGGGNPPDSKTVGSAVDRLVGLLVLETVPGSSAKFRGSNLGRECLRSMVMDDANKGGVGA